MGGVACSTKYRVNPLNQRGQIVNHEEDQPTDVYSSTYKFIFFNLMASILKRKIFHIKIQNLGFLEISEYHTQLAHMAMTTSI